jgi:hypothetical protein
MRKFMNLYRLVKSLSLLNHLYLSESIPRTLYNEEVKETQQKIQLLKEALKTYDIRRFCELWGIEVEYNSIGVNSSLLKSEFRVSIGVARVANLLPSMNDEVFQATTYG